MEPTQDTQTARSVVNFQNDYHRRDLNIQRLLASKKPLAEAWFVNENGRWVKWKYHKELETNILHPITQREIDEAVWNSHQDLDWRDLFPKI